MLKLATGLDLQPPSGSLGGRLAMEDLVGAAGEK